jgi:hypothetical protein
MNIAPHLDRWKNFSERIINPEFTRNRVHSEKTMPVAPGMGV